MPIRYRTTIDKLYDRTATFGDVALCLEMASDAAIDIAQHITCAAPGLSTLAKLVLDARTISITDPSLLARQLIRIEQQIAIVRGQGEKP